MLGVDINQATSVATSLSLVLLLCESLTLGNNQLLVSLSSIIISVKGVGSELGINISVFWNSGERNVGLLALDDWLGRKWGIKLLCDRDGGDGDLWLGYVLESSG